MHGIRRGHGDAVIDAFNHLSVLLSIILGLAITQILLGLRALIHARDRVHGGAPTLIWCIALLLMYAQGWWSLFGLRDHAEWTFAEFAVILAQVTLQYLLAAIVLPEVPAHDAVDLRRHYAAQQRWFFGLAIAMTATSLLKDVVFEGRLPDGANLAFHLGFIVACAIAGSVRSARYALFNAIVVAIVLGAYIFALFARLGMP
ncbi:MAG: hypothetical protein J0L88_15915 [Xanthomonadales bacterium]|nr:hypothetical protein [Xanthomonadales bacterium]